MPARVIRGEIVSSESLSHVSLEAEMVFMRLLLVVDDYGRADARLPLLRSQLFPMRPAFTERKLAACLDELAAGDDPPIRLYEHEGRTYLYLPKWEIHRGKTKRSQTSRFPDPNEAIPGDSGRSAEIRSGVGVGVGVGEGGGVGLGDADASPPPAFSESDDGAWLLPQLRLNAKATPAERACWLEARFGEIAAAARIEADTQGGSVRDHGRKIASARWNAYLRERDPTRRDAAREASAREKRAVLEASKAAEAAPARASPGSDEDPLADLLPFRTREVAP